MEGSIQAKLTSIPSTSVFFRKVKRQESDSHLRVVQRGSLRVRLETERISAGPLLELAVIAPYEAPDRAESGGHQAYTYRGKVRVGSSSRLDFRLRRRGHTRKWDGGQPTLRSAELRWDGIHTWEPSA